MQVISRMISSMAERRAAVEPTSKRPGHWLQPKRRRSWFRPGLLGTVSGPHSRPYDGGVCRRFVRIADPKTAAFVVGSAVRTVPRRAEKLDCLHQTLQIQRQLTSPLPPPERRRPRITTRSSAARSINDLSRARACGLHVTSIVILSALPIPTGPSYNKSRARRLADPPQQALRRQAPVIAPEHTRGIDRLD